MAMGQLVALEGRVQAHSSISMATLEGQAVVVLVLVLVVAVAVEVAVPAQV
jgi:hypothetical protein